MKKGYVAIEYDKFYILVYIHVLERLEENTLNR